ncbi:MAG: hypothetical protein UW86_C0010G0017 [Microgenomates group bacterium GW2011_GWA1_Microgenomates_45_10]|nr:MAG: hypothetical protein UW86_C0010G0017 [Microgenomates group bacterium GW2011_GWA1_Microgenomates_45_10]
MKKFLIVFFVILGVIFLVGALIGIGFFIANMNSPKTNSGNTSDTDVQADGGFSLSDAQKSALQAFGIDISTIPSYITPEQEACFTLALGADRVAEIKAGAVPNAIDFFKAKSCI